MRVKTELRAASVAAPVKLHILAQHITRFTATIVEDLPSNFLVVYETIGVDKSRLLISSLRLLILPAEITVTDRFIGEASQKPESQL